jgi:hypothetical protein
LQREREKREMAILVGFAWGGGVEDPSLKHTLLH